MRTLSSFLRPSQDEMVAPRGANQAQPQLTRKQALAVQRANGPSAKNALRKTFGAQNAVERRRPAAMPRAPALRVPRPISLHHAFNAFDKRHLPVDEVTAPYSITNFVNVMEFSTFTDKDQVIVVCPRTLFMQEMHTGPLTDFIAFRYDAASTIGVATPWLSYVRTPLIDAPALAATRTYSSVRARLHNLSVRLECLGTNTGLYPPGSAYIGTVPALENGDRSTGAQQSLTIKDAWAMDSIMVGYLTSIPAASLVEKPVQVDSAIAENVSYKAWRDVAVPDSAMELGALPFSTALEPIVVYVPRCGEGTTTVQYRMVIGQEWCSRHPNNVMLRATQTQHAATSPDLWHKAVSSVRDIGPKVLARGAEGAIDALVSSVRRGLTPPNAAALAEMA